MKNKEGILFSYFKMFEGLPSWSSGLDSMLSLQGAWAKKKKFETHNSCSFSAAGTVVSIYKG